MKILTHALATGWITIEFSPDYLFAYASKFMSECFFIRGWKLSRFSESPQNSHWITVKTRPWSDNKVCILTIHSTSEMSFRDFPLENCFGKNVTKVSLWNVLKTVFFETSYEIKYSAFIPSLHIALPVKALNSKATAHGSFVDWAKT